MSQADEPSYAELKRLYAELVLECAAAKDRNVAYRLQIAQMPLVFGDAHIGKDERD